MVKDKYLNFGALFIKRPSLRPLHGTLRHEPHTASFAIHAVAFVYTTRPFAFSEHLSTSTFNVSSTTTTIRDPISTSHADNNTEVPGYAFAPTVQITNQDRIPTSRH